MFSLKTGRAVQLRHGDFSLSPTEFFTANKTLKPDHATN